MKKIFLTLSIIVLSTNGQAQNRAIDSLKRLFAIAKDDSTRATLLIRLGGRYTYSKPDTALLLDQQGLDLARKIGFLKGVAGGYNNLSIVYQTIGNYPKALDYQILAMKIDEKRNDPGAVARDLGNIGSVYSTQGDNRKCINYSLKAIAMFKKLHNKERMVVPLSNVGSAYVDLKMLDSARIYTQQAYEIAARVKDVGSIGITMSTLGDIYAEMNKPQIALGYYRNALPYFTEVTDDQNIGRTWLGMAEVFKQTGQRDSSLYYAKKALSIARSGGFTAAILNGSEFLTAYFKSAGKPDSALRYLELSIAAKDSLFSQEKIKEIQSLSLAEQQRQQEIAEQKRLSDEANKRNLQLAGIAIFIPTFFLFLLFLSRRRIKARTVDFLGVLLLLLTFEFISMLIRPYVAQVQHLVHDAPAIAMFINIGLATLLVPVHRPIERWVKGKLAHKPKTNHQLS